MGFESIKKEDIQRYYEFAQTPEGRAIIDPYIFRAIIHAEYPELKDPDSVEPDPNSYRMMRIIKPGTAKPPR